MSDGNPPVQGTLFPMPESAPQESLRDLITIGEGLAVQLHEHLTRLRVAVERSPEFLADLPQTRAHTIGRIREWGTLMDSGRRFLGELVELSRKEDERAELRQRIADLRDAAQKLLISGNHTGAAEKTAEAEGLARQLLGGARHG
jgi:hypothetical protein